MKAMLGGVILPEPTQVFGKNLNKVNIHFIKHSFHKSWREEKVY